MKTIIGPRGSGKTKELLKFASDNGCAVFSPDARALYVKAHAYGYDNIEIYGFNDEPVDSRKYPIVIHDVNKFVQQCFPTCVVKGFSATMEDTDD